MDKKQQQGVFLITKVEQQKRSKRRYNIYLNDEYSLSVHEDVIVSCRLIKGREIDEKELEKITLEEEKKKIERTGLHYLSYSARTAKEIERHLKSKEFNDELIKSSISEWVRIGYLNDHTFAQQWCRERIELKKKGRHVVREELKQKGISNTIIEEVLSNLDNQSEYEACLDVARKKAILLKGAANPKTRVKLFQFLQRRGYPFETIQKVYNELRISQEE
jgi:regulatory protein